MELSRDDLERLRNACKTLPPGKDYRCNDFVQNLLQTALDFQMDSDVVDEALKFAKKKSKITTIEQLESVLSNYKDSEEGNKSLANNLWNNNHWTRANFLRVLVAEFNNLGIRDQDKLRSWLEKADFELDVEGKFRSEHHNIGFAIFHWLCLRCGIPTIKPDLHVLKFVENVTGQTFSPSRSELALIKVASILNVEPYL